MADTMTAPEGPFDALRDPCDAVDAVCDSDAFSSENTLEPHARTVLELALQRAKDALREAGRA